MLQVDTDLHNQSSTDYKNNKITLRYILSIKLKSRVEQVWIVRNKITLLIPLWEPPSVFSPRDSSHLIWL